MFDFASDGRVESTSPGRNDKGLMTYDRKTRKDVFYWYKANWTTPPFVYITSRRFINRTEPKTQVKIYSNCDAVELKINGVSQGVVHSDNHIFLWNDRELQLGENRIEAIGTKVGRSYADSCSWNVVPNVRKL